MISLSSRAARMALLALVLVSSSAATGTAVQVLGAERQPKEMRLEPGSVATTESGSITGRESRQFLVRASGGQTVSLSLSSRNRFLYFNFERSTGTDNGNRLLAREVTDWTGRVSETGDYLVTVYLVRAEARRGRTASFRLTVGSGGPSETGASRTVWYDCPAGLQLQATFDSSSPRTAVVDLGKTRWVLPQSPSASGARYSDGTVTFWTKGDGARLEAPGLMLACTARETGARQVDLAGPEWGLKSVTTNGATSPLPEGVSIDATFEEGRVSGKGVCNRYFASYSATADGAITVGDVGATLMMCPSHAEFERRYFALLKAATKYSIRDGVLELTGPSGSLSFVESR